MRFLTLFLLLSVMSASLSARAELPLNQANMQAYFDVLTGLSGLEKKYPHLRDEIAMSEDEIGEPGLTMLTDGGKQWAQVIRNLPMADEVIEIIEDNGFDSPEAFTNLGSRLMSGLMAVGMEATDVDMQQALTELDQQLAQMKAAKMDPALIAQMEAGMAQSKQMMVQARAAQSTVSEADLSAVRANRAWLEQQFNKLDNEAP